MVKLGDTVVLCGIKAVSKSHLLMRHAIRVEVISKLVCMSGGLFADFLLWIN